ncbi:class C beta-lactamase [Pseudomonas sp. Pseusp122]|uniref:class C beta-lactamase n=1 Tax=unclassified Pseudomonas TaxID=196821 RepID=UPI0039A6FBD9
MPISQKISKGIFAATTLLLSCIASAQTPDSLQTLVDHAVLPTMKAQNIAGMAVAVIKDGKPRYFYYGLSSRDTMEPLSRYTLFELGSISKTYTATLAAWAQAQGKLQLTDIASQHLPALKNSAFAGIRLLNLATYTAGGLPLQFPDAYDSQDKMLDYFTTWKPTEAVGARRQYSNPSIGLFGYLAAQSLGKPFNELMEGSLFPELGLKSSYIDVPKTEMSFYAQGYTRTDQPIRLKGGALAAEAYGVKTNLEDMTRFVQLNMQAMQLPLPLQQAIAITHNGYYRVGDMSQGLGWESYAWPLRLDALQTGNAPEMASQPHTVQWLSPAQVPEGDVLFNKTGSTNGFGNYVAFVPGKGLGVVILANKNYPNADRVKIAYEILQAASR